MAQENQSLIEFLRAAIQLDPQVARCRTCSTESILQTDEQINIFVEAHAVCDQWEIFTLR